MFSITANNSQPTRHTRAAHVAISVKDNCPDRYGISSLLTLHRRKQPADLNHDLVNYSSTSNRCRIRYTLTFVCRNPDRARFPDFGEPFFHRPRETFEGLINYYWSSLPFLVVLLVWSMKLLVPRTCLLFQRRSGTNGEKCSKKMRLSVRKGNTVPRRFKPVFPDACFAPFILDWARKKKERRGNAIERNSSRRLEE